VIIYGAGMLIVTAAATPRPDAGAPLVDPPEPDDEAAPDPGQDAASELVASG